METHFHHTEVGQFLAYANTILQAYIQLEVDGWWAYNQGGRPGIGGLGHPPPPPPLCTHLYGTGQERKLLSGLRGT